MGRGYLIFIVCAGMFGAILGQGGGSSTPTPNSMRAASVDSGESDMSSSSSSSSSSNPQDGAIELQRNGDGHFYADVQINGTSVRALVDTGASGIALSREDARSAGIGTSIAMPEVVGEGANGAVHGEYVKLDSVALGSKRVEGMSAVVLSSGGMTLLGQSFLSQFAKVEIEGDRMVLR